MIARLRGLAAVVVLAVLMVGLPALLVSVAAVPGVFSMDRLGSLLTSPDDGRLILVVLWALGWVVWLVLAGLVVVEIAAAVRGVKPPQFRGLALPQVGVRQLVAAAALLFVVAPSVAVQPSPAGAAPPSVTAAAAAAPTPATTTPPSADSSADVVVKEHVVGPGDTLFKLAQKYLGNGWRYPEIFHTNAGMVQSNGATLTDPDMIIDGTRLRIEVRAAPTTPAAITHTVRAGETVESVARKVLGSTQRADEVVAATPAAANGLRAGMRLVIPVTDPTHTVGPAQQETPPVVSSPTPKPTPPPTASAPERPDVEMPPVPAPLPAPQQTTTPTANPEPTTSPEESDSAEPAPQFSWQVAGLIGPGAVSILAVGIAGALWWRRRMQFRHRRPGRMIQMPADVMAPIEKTVQLVGPPSAAAVARLDAVLRRTAQAMGGVPTIRLIGLSGDGAVTIPAESVDFPTPWECQRRGWVLDPSVDLDEIGADPGPDVSAPWPMLVTIGADDSHTSWLLNLEQVGVLRVGGDPQMRDDLIRYIAAELAVNGWARTVRAACLGPARGVVPMGGTRFSSTIDDLPETALETADRAAALGVDAPTGRLSQAGGEDWPALVLVSDVPSALVDIVDGHPSCTGAAVVLTTPGQSADLMVSRGGRVTGFGVDLIAAGLTEDEAEGCAAILGVAEHVDDVPVPAVTDLIDATGSIIAPDGDGSGTSILDITEEDYSPTVTVEELPVIAPPVTEQTREKLSDPTLDADVAAWLSPTGKLPKLAVLGPVAATCHGKPLAKSRSYFTELLAYLALRPLGATSEDIADAFGITVERSRTNISQLRDWLGINPLTGSKHLPYAKNTTGGRRTGVGVYQVEGLLTDWALFRRLRTRAQTRGKDGLTDLETALSLVTGRPFSQLRSGGWTWLSDGDRVDQHATVAIVDVAHTLTVAYLQKGVVGPARAATEIALRACPGEAITELDLAAIQVAEGNQAAAERILAGISNTPDPDTGAPADLPPRVQEILTSSRWKKAV